MMALLYTFNITHLFHKIKVTFSVFFLVVSMQAFAAEGLSEVNNALFDSPHMQSIKTTGKINYLYKKLSANEENKNDSVTVDIIDLSEDGRTDQSYTFFMGKNQKNYPTRKNIIGNGIFMMFLEWDVHQMERQTQGSWRHFQRRIRWAMAAGDEKKKVEITYQDKKIKATQYSIQPYANDKKSERYGDYANKVYLFTLSKDIPGTIYQVRTIVPKNKDWKEGDDVVIDEQITFTSFQKNPT